MSGHDGARERLRERFWRGGLDGFPDVHVLELLLTYAIPRRETSTAGALRYAVGCVRGFSGGVRKRQRNR